MKKSYLDANILIAISVGPDKERDQFRMARGVLNDIKNGVIIGIVSPLVLMEVISVMRKQKGQGGSGSFGFDVTRGAIQVCVA